MAEATAVEQLLLELINRARIDPAGEAKRYGIDLNKDLPAGTITSAPKQVLAFNPLLNDAAAAHSQWMLDTDTFSHTGDNASSPGARMTAEGYAFTGSWTWGENIAWSGTTGTMNANTAIFDHHRNLFLSSGHRENILNGDFREVGLGSLTGTFTTGGTAYNSLMTTEDFAKSGAKLFITGVTYTDSDSNDFYSIGEGAGGRAVQLVQNGVLVATTSSGTAGGYALGTTVTGAVDVQFSGGGLAGTMAASVTLAGSNIKVDLVDGNTILSNASTILRGASANLTLLGIEAINGAGNTLANVIAGNGAANIIVGQAGDDQLLGCSGTDRLSGGTGSDTLDGGAGTDRLRGGAGADHFVFSSLADAASGKDLIIDFQDGIDVIDLHLIDAVAGGADQAFNLLAAGQSLKAGYLHIFQTATQTCVEGDVTGDGAADFMIKLAGLHNLTAADFVL